MLLFTNSRSSWRIVAHWKIVCLESGVRLPPAAIGMWKCVRVGSVLLEALRVLPTGTDKRTALRPRRPFYRCLRVLFFRRMWKFQPMPTHAELQAATTSATTNDVDPQVKEKFQQIRAQILQFNSRLRSLEQSRRWNGLVSAVKTGFRKINLTRRGHAMTVLHPSNAHNDQLDSAEGLPVFVDIKRDTFDDGLVNERVFIEGPASRRYVDDSTTGSFRCFCGLMTSLAMMVPHDFSDNFHCGMARMLPCLERNFDGFNWAPLPSVKENGEVVWTMHIFPNAKRDEVVTYQFSVCAWNRSATQQSTQPPRLSSSCRRCTSRVVVQRQTAKFGDFDADEIQFGGFNAGDPAEPSFSGLVVMTLYVHWRHNELALALHHVGAALDSVTPPSARWSGESELSGASSLSEFDL